MSLILEALRKSEAERRRGQAPGLFTPDANVLMPVAREKSRALLAAVVVLMVAAIVYILWRGLQGTAPPRASPPTDAITTQETSLGAVNQSLSSGAKRENIDTTTASTIEAAPTAAPAMPSPTPTPTAQSSLANAPKPIPLAAPPASMPTPAATPETSVSSEPPAVTLAALSTERRNQLPPLKLSMHVYAEETGKRFAIIDGQRITEGSMIGSAVVRAIRRDGVLLDIDGSNYLLPRP